MSTTTSSSYAVTIHGYAVYEHVAPDYGQYSEPSQGLITDWGIGDKPDEFDLLDHAISNAESAIATGAYHYDHIATDFRPERISICNQDGCLITAGHVRESKVIWSPSNLAIG